MNSIRFAGQLLLLLLLFAANAAQALTSQHDLLLDIDGQAGTGCSISTPDGPFDGVETILSMTVRTDGLAAANVTEVTLSECTDPATDTFGTPVNLGGGWPVGVGEGLAGFHVIETSAPVPPALRFRNARIGIVASNELGDSATLLDVNGTSISLRGLPPLPVPLAAGVVLFGLALALLFLGLLVLGRRGRLTLTSLVLMLGAGAVGAGAAYSGVLAEWGADDLLAETSASDSEGGVEIRAIFGQRSGDGLTAFFRIDSALVFAAPPILQADDYTTELTAPISEGPASGLLANDDRGLPATDLANFGGGDLSADVTDHAAGATVAVGADGSLTVNADGSFDFQAETGFDGPLTFDYRLENVAGTADATVTIAVQRSAGAVDDAFDVLAGETLDIGNDALLANDTGWPAPQVSVFGGGDLGGTVDDNTAGDTVTVGGDGSLSVNADGQVVFTPSGGFTGDFSFDYRIDNPAGTDTATVIVTVNEAPTITSAGSFSCSVGSVCDFSFAADGYPQPTIIVAGALPAGVTFNAGSESLEGTPQAGSGAVYALTVTAANGIGSDAEQTFTLTVSEAPTITSADSLGCEVSALCDFTVSADGHPAPTFSLPGLPAGLNLDASTGVISGQPDSGTGGEYNLVLEADNSEGSDTQNFTLTVGQPPAITSSDTLDCAVGQGCSLTLAADGFPAPDFSVTGALPDGVTFDGAVLIDGTPQAGSGAVYTLTVTAANGIAPDDVQTLTLTVNEAPTITSTASLDCEVGVPCDFTASADGHPAPTFSLPGLPAGLSVDAASGAFSGQPGPGTGGEYNLVLEASNSEGSASQNFALTIGQAPEITSPAALTCEVGQACSFAATADGYPDPSFTLPDLPAGLGFDGVSGALSGTPDAGMGGVYNLTLTAANGVNPDATQNFELTVNEAPTITSPDAATCQTGQACNVQFTADGFPSPDFSLTGALPAGVNFDAGTGTLSGTPSAGTGGEYVLDLTAANGIAPEDMQAFTLTVEQAPTITSGASQTCEVGQPCGFSFAADGYPDPVIALAGTLPAGVSFDAAAETLGGTPQAGSGGQYALTVTAANGVAPEDLQNFTLTVNEAPTANDDPTGGIPAGSSPGSIPYHGAFDTALTVSAADGVLDNDTLGFPQASITTPNPAAANGSVSLAGDGSFVYTPDSGFTGLDSFQYCIENVATDSCATVTVAIGERPSASDDTYPATLLGNVAVDTAASSGYSLLNFAGGDAITLAVDGTTNGDAVLNGDGTFEFNPAAGFSGGNATLAYSVSNGFGTATGSVTLPVGNDRIWFADNSASPGDGRLGSPFDSLAALDSAADAPGDVLFLSVGSGAYTGGITLLDGQFLIGEAAGAAIATIAGLSVPADSSLPATGGGQPSIVNAGGSGVSLSVNNILRGFAVSDTSGPAIDGAAFGTLTVREIDVVGTGPVLSLDSGTGDAIFDTLSSSSASGDAIDLVDVDGALDLGTGSVAGMSGAAMRVSGGIAGISYSGSLQKSSEGEFLRIDGRSAGNIALTGNLACTDSCGGAPAGSAVFTVENVTGGMLSFTGSSKDIEPASPAGGLLLVNNPGATIDIDGNLSITTTDSAGILASGGGTLDLDIPSLSLQVNGESALSVDGMTLIGQVDSGALIVDGALGAGVFAVSIANSQLPSGFTLGTDLEIDLDDAGESGGGVSLNNNSGSLGFTQWNRVNTNTTPALSTSNAGTLGISPTSAGSAGTLDGIAVSISGTEFGSTGVTFTEVYNTNARGIVLDNVGGAGGFTVTGIGSPVTVGSGGTLTGSPDNAVRLVNARNVSLGGMIVANTGSHGIYGTGLSASTPGSGGNAFSFHDGEINGAGDGNDENAIHFGDGPGIDNVSDAVTLHNVVFDAYAENALHLANETVAADISVSGSLLRNAATTTNSNGLLLQSLTGASASFDLTVTGTTFGQPFGGSTICCTGVTYNAQGSGVHSLVVQNNTFENMSRAGAGQGISVATTETGEMSVDISNNQFIDLDGANVGLAPLEDSSMSGTIVGNTFTAPNIEGVAISIVGDGEEGSIPTSMGTFTGVFSIADNTIGTATDRFSAGIRLLSRDTSNPAGRMDFTVTNNTVHSLGSGAETVMFNSLDSATLCADVSGNTITTDAGSIFDDIGLLQQGASVMNVAQTSAADVTSSNGGASLFTAGTLNFNSSCTTP